MKQEYLDIYDENNRSLGISKPRSEVHQTGLWHRTVHIHIINGQGDYLVHLRSPYKDLFPNCWDTRFGGHVVAGASYEETVIKELEEELGLSVEPKDLIFACEKKSDIGMNREYAQVYFYKFDGNLSDLKFSDSEVVAVKWLSAASILDSINKEPNIWTTRLESFKKIELLKEDI